MLCHVSDASYPEGRLHTLNLDRLRLRSVSAVCVCVHAGCGYSASPVRPVQVKLIAI